MTRSMLAINSRHSDQPYLKECLLIGISSFHNFPRTRAHHALRSDEFRKNSTGRRGGGGERTSRASRRIRKGEGWHYVGRSFTNKGMSWYTIGLVTISPSISRQNLKKKWREIQILLVIWSNSCRFSNLGGSCWGIQTGSFAVCDLVSQRSRGHRLCSGQGSGLCWAKIFFCSFCWSRKIKKSNFFLTKKPHFFGFLRANRDLDDVLGPPSFTPRVHGYEKPIYKGARVISGMVAGT